MPSAAAQLKRPERSASFASLPDAGQPRAKRQERAPAEPQAEFDHAAPLLPPLGLETKTAFFRRLGARLRRDLFSVAHDFKQDGLYVYKRPVRSGQGTERGALLAAAGSVFHHAVLYVKHGDELTALEFGPANGMDITENMLSEAPAGPVLLRPAPQPDPACLPMLHVDLPVHALQDAVVQQALAFAQAQPYHALRQNCICFADFIARVLTGGVLKGAPLIFDLLVGMVPAADPPLLQLLSLFQLSWHDVCDGGRLLRAFLQQHPGAVLQPPAGAAAGGKAVGSILLESEDGIQASFILPPVQQPTDSSGSDDMHFGSVGAEPGATSAGASLAAASASVASNLASLASTGDSRTPRGGVRGLPARPPRGRPANRC
ncbi:hypothetical protein COHA_007291 [Chlorella ohadii]|uniref:PPPDE domain-containing protein n=1 Tax=Chlorella ohadii TaxID=2649997 RepID=A0AAD5DM36_9CHLO|nr:hypothetical protein COHA_007291 [Chlorella ohadii]